MGGHYELPIRFCETTAPDTENMAIRKSSKKAVTEPRALRTVRKRHAGPPGERICSFQVRRESKVRPRNRPDKRYSIGVPQRRRGGGRAAREREKKIEKDLVGEKRKPCSVAQEETAFTAD